MPLDLSYECVNPACPVGVIADWTNGCTVNPNPPVGDAQQLLCRGCYKPVVTEIRRLDVPISEIDSTTHGLLGWPHQGKCECGARAVLCSATRDSATYECRGTPSGSSAYGDDRCGKVFTVPAHDVARLNTARRRSGLLVTAVNEYRVSETTNEDGSLTVKFEWARPPQGMGRVAYEWTGSPTALGRPR